MSGSNGQDQNALGGGFVSAIRAVEGSAPGDVSPKGAQGVMQVMPGTQMAPGFGLQPSDGSPGDVQRLGEQYARAMLSRYSGNQVLAAAAYNAGPGNVDRWLAQYGDPRTGTISNAAWQSLVPFKETQQYIGRVAPGSLGQSGQGPGASASPPNALGSPEAPVPVVTQTEPEGSKALALMQMLLPNSHKFVPVDYDPWSVVKAGGSSA